MSDNGTITLYLVGSKANIITGSKELAEEYAKELGLNVTEKEYPRHDYVLPERMR